MVYHISTGIKSNLRQYILVGFFIIMLASGCARKEERMITFSVGGAPKELEFWDVLAAEFEKESGIKVDILRQPTDTDQRRQGLVISLKSKKSDPDVFLMDVAWLAQFAASSWLEPLDDYMRKDKFEEGVFFRRIINLADRYEGKLVALPVYVDGGLLYYRRDLLVRYGVSSPPGTWEELIGCSLKIQGEMRKTNPHFYGFVWQGAQYEGLICNFLEFAVSNGGGIILEADKILLNLPQNIEALQLMHDLIKRFGISPPSTFTEMKEEEVRTFFERGDALFERNWPYAWPLHQSSSSAVRGKIGLAALPHFNSYRSAATLGGWHIGISRFSEVKDMSWRFVKFILSYSIQKRLALQLGWNPGRVDVYRDGEVLDKLPHFASLGQVFENAHPRPLLPYYTQVSDVLQRYLNSALAGQLTAAEAILAAERDAQKLIERYR